MSALGIALPEFNELQDLYEIHNMLAERVKKQPDRWMAKGREQGLEWGRTER